MDHDLWTILQTMSTAWSVIPVNRLEPKFSSFNSA